MAAYVERHLKTFEWHGLKFGVLVCNELWATALGVPVLEVNAPPENKPANASSGLISGDGRREIIVPDTGR